MDSEGRARPLWLGCSGAGAQRGPLSIAGSGLGSGAGSTQACAGGPRKQGASEQRLEAGQAREAVPPPASRGGGRRGSLEADLHGHGPGVGVPHKH